MSRLGFVGFVREDQAARVLAAIDGALQDPLTIDVEAEVIEDDRPTLRAMPAASTIEACRPLDEVILECLMVDGS